MLLLNRDEIKKVFSMYDAIEADKECYKAFSEGKFDVPLRAVINGSAGNFLFMPAYNEEMKAAGLKIVNIMPGNPAKGLPASIGQVLLIDGETGVVKAMMDGTYITALRTAAASGAAFDLFGLKDAKIGAMIGTGSQAMCQLEAMLSGRKLKEVRVAARNFEKTKAFAERAAMELGHYGAKVIPVIDANDAVD
jgi:ornithine cyclodeaminase